LRVMHVVSTGHRRGAEVFVADLARALGPMGIDQIVTILHGDEPGEVNFGVDTIGLMPGPPKVPGLRLDGGILRGIRHALATWAPTVLQAHGGEALKHSIVAARGKVPVVYRRIGSTDGWGRMNLRRAAHARLVRRAQHVICVSDSARREIVRSYGVPLRRASTIPNAVDLDRIKPTRARGDMRAELGIPSEAHLLLSVGALTWEKDPVAQVEVADRVLRADGDARFVICGDGPLRTRVEADVAERGLEGRVVLAGNRPDVVDVMAAADALVLASRTEGMPGVVIEAGLMGLPVVAYSIAGVPEVVADGLTGRLVPPGDIGGLAAGVLELFADSDLRYRYGTEARKLCADFDIVKIAPRYARLYESVSDERKVATVTS
jgi:L-malate glycosyltransferase